MKMEVRSNTLTHYYYQTLLVLTVIIFSSLQFQKIYESDSEITDLALFLAIEIVLVSLTWFLVARTKIVSVSREKFLFDGEEYEWQEVLFIRKFFLLDFYCTKIKDEGYVLFFGNRTPFGFWGFLHQENLMEQIVNSIKKKYNY